MFVLFQDGGQVCKCAPGNLPGIVLLPTSTEECWCQSVAEGARHMQYGIVLIADCS